MDLVGVRESEFWRMTPGDARQRLRVYRWRRRQRQKAAQDLAATMTAHVLAALTGRRVKPADLLRAPKPAMGPAERQRKWEELEKRMKEQGEG